MIGFNRNTLAWLGPPSAQRDFVRACAAVFLLNAADSSVTVVAPAYLRSLGYPVAQIGILVSAYAIASLCSRLPAGRLADGQRPRRWFALACVALSVALALYPVGVDAWAFWSVRALHGLAFGAATTLNLAAALASGTRARARAMGLYTAVMAAGFTAGNLLGGVLTDAAGYDTTFRATALFPLLATVLGARSAAPAAIARGGGESWLAVLRRREVRGVLLLAVTINLLHQTWGTLFPLYVVAMGAGLSLAGGVRAMHAFTNTVFRPFGDPIVRRFGSTGLACVGLVLYAIGISALPTTTVPLVLMALAAVIGAGRACAYLANVVTTADLSEQGIVNRGTASALLSLGTDTGSILAPIIAGAVAGRIGIGPALQLLPIGTAALGIVAVLTSRPRAAPATEAAVATNVATAP